MQLIQSYTHTFCHLALRHKKSGQTIILKKEKTKMNSIYSYLKLINLLILIFFCLSYQPHFITTDTPDRRDIGLGSRPKELSEARVKIWSNGTTCTSHALLLFQPILTGPRDCQFPRYNKRVRMFNVNLA